MAGQRRALKPTVVDLNRFCAGLARRLRRSLPSGIEVELVAGVGLWPVVLDEEGLTAAVTELVHNACEAMPAGGRLTIETQNARLGGDYAAMRPGLQTGEYVRITIRDTGPGLSAEETQRALRPFRSSKDRTRHFGLGLNAAYGFARQSGGSMAIEVGEGRGARAALYFPRGEARWSEADRVEPALTWPVAKRLAAGR